MRLALDTSADFCSVAVGDAEGNVLAAFHEAQERGHAETLIPLIEKALRQSQSEASALREILVITGPGTFAGVRVGVSAAQALAFATGAKALGLTGFEALIGLAVERHGAGLPPHVLAALPGRGPERAAELFAREKGRTPPWKSVAGPALAKPGEAGRWLKGKDALLFGPAAEGLRSELPPSSLRAECAWPSAADLLRMARFFPRARWGREVLPFYLRAPDAKPSVFVAHG